MCSSYCNEQIGYKEKQDEKQGKNHQERKERTNNRNVKARGSFYRKYENGLNQAPRKSRFWKCRLLCVKESKLCTDEKWKAGK